MKRQRPLFCQILKCGRKINLFAGIEQKSDNANKMAFA